MWDYWKVGSVKDKYKITLKDYELKLIFNDNFDIRYVGKIHRTKKFKPFRWYHFVLFIWGLLKFYIELLTCLFYLNSDWFWNSTIEDTQYGKNFLIKFIPKYKQKAIPKRMEVEFNPLPKLAEIEIIEIPYLEFGYKDEGKGKLWNKNKINKTYESGEFTINEVGEIYEFSIRKFFNFLINSLNDNSKVKEMNINLTNLENRVIDTITENLRFNIFN